MTLRDELAAVLGPGNDDRIAYAQADSVLGVLMDTIGDPARDLQAEVEYGWDERYAGPWPPDGWAGVGPPLGDPVDFEHGRFCPPGCATDHRVNYGRA